MRVLAPVLRDRGGVGVEQQEASQRREPEGQRRARAHPGRPLAAAPSRVVAVAAREPSSSRSALSETFAGWQSKRLVRISTAASNFSDFFSEDKVRKRGLLGRRCLLVGLKSTADRNGQLVLVMAYNDDLDRVANTLA